jgi:hypothetical protein
MKLPIPKSKLQINLDGAVRDSQELVPPFFAWQAGVRRTLGGDKMAV